MHVHRNIRLQIFTVKPMTMGFHNKNTLPMNSRHSVVSKNITTLVFFCCCHILLSLFLKTLLSNSIRALAARSVRFSFAVLFRVQHSVCRSNCCRGLSEMMGTCCTFVMSTLWRQSPEACAPDAQVNERIGIICATQLGNEYGLSNLVCQANVSNSQRGIILHMTVRHSKHILN